MTAISAPTRLTEACHWAAFLLATAVLAWSTAFLFIVVAADNGVGVGLSTVALFSYPIVIACFLWRGVITRRGSMTTASAWVYILAPGLWGLAYVPAGGAALLAAYLQSRDSR